MDDTKGGRAVKRFGPATWNGDLREGKGRSRPSRALESHPYTFFSRYGEAGPEPGV
jgi:osmotically inducible protein OsmC